MQKKYIGIVWLIWRGDGGDGMRWRSTVMISNIIILIEWILIAIRK